MRVNAEKNPIKDKKEMVGDFLRESAALILIFAFLDKLVFGQRIGPWWVVATVVCSGVFLSLGISLERRRLR